MCPSNSDKYRLQALPNKGFGLVATRDIQESELLIAESPLLKVELSPEGDLVGKFCTAKREFISPALVQVLNKLPDNDLFKFYTLSDSCSANLAQEHGLHDLQKAYKTNFGIMKTNSFSMEFENQTYLTLFPTISRLNHSCQPNCNHYWSGSYFKVRAIKPISAGEELTISYMSPLQRADFHSRQSRRKILSEEFGFECGCNLCSSELHQMDQNDTDRIELLQIEQEWVHLGQEPRKALHLAQKQLDIGQRLDLHAGLLAYIALHCVEAASCVVTRKISEAEAGAMRQTSLQYSQLAQKYGNVAYGSLSYESEVYANLYEACQNTSDSQLFSTVQTYISKLRDNLV